MMQLDDGAHSELLRWLDDRVRRTWPGGRVEADVTVSGLLPAEDPIPNELRPAEAHVTIPTAHGAIEVRLNFGSEIQKQNRVYEIAVTVEGDDAPIEDEVDLDGNDPFADVGERLFESVQRKVNTPHNGP
jgi:hypothetical protein